MEPILTKLNQAAAQKLKQSSPAISQADSGQASPFQQMLDQKTSTSDVTEKLMDKLREDYALDPKNTMNVLSADDVTVTSQSQELGESGPGSSGSRPSDKLADMFKGMNRDLVNLDATIETLTAPGVRLSPSQLLALQVGVANTTLMAGFLSKFVDSVAGTIRNLNQMQV